MLHAADYSNMNYGQMMQKVNDSKKKDMRLAKAMQCFQYLHNSWFGKVVNMPYNMLFIHCYFFTQA